MLRDLMRGIPPMFFLNLSNHKNWWRKILDSYAVTSDPGAAVMYDEMTTRKFITNDQMAQYTASSSGVEITVSFDEIEREGLPGNGFCVRGMESGVRRGSFTSRWDLNR